MAKTACTKEKHRMPSPLKCFVAHDGYEGLSIQFAQRNVQARRWGANEMNCSFEEVESCKRKPEWDKYSPGPVPIEAQLSAGWYCSCSQCERLISEDGADWQEVEEEAKAGYYCERILPHPTVITWGGLVFCGPDCAWDWIQNKRLKAIVKDALEAWGIERVKELCPEAIDIFARSEASGFEPWWVEVSFMFPGGQYPAHYYWSKDAGQKWQRKNGLTCARDDEAAWYRYRPAPEKGEVA
ncbi:hypothetical protein K6W37_10110 [Acetobacter senegalensis]|uniref:hypothetical protein n=1 Tax=Acetobacter senegalensis TaxID=446692 RepID=UPI001EDBCEB3|nr:hypothetical protein [Acetobacter senegalensis]MCG4254239.1 hypothetical protein [Acetobacter senegalensis]